MAWVFFKRPDFRFFRFHRHGATEGPLYLIKLLYRYACSMLKVSEVFAGLRLRARPWLPTADGTVSPTQSANQAASIRREESQYPLCTLKLGYMVPNSGYLGPNRG